MSLRLDACAGNIQLHSASCSFDPCQVKQDIRHIMSKLEPLGDLVDL
jgi:hypothetical protein